MDYQPAVLKIWEYGDLLYSEKIVGRGIDLMTFIQNQFYANT